MTFLNLSIFFTLLAAAAFVISWLSFHKKGFPIHTIYIYASKKEREQIDKAPLYRVSARVFLIAGVGLVMLAAECLLMTDWLMLGALIVLFFDCMYAYWLTHKIEYPNGRKWRRRKK